jgi:hypothetical protein
MKRFRVGCGSRCGGGSGGGVGRTAANSRSSCTNSTSWSSRFASAARCAASANCRAVSVAATHCSASFRRSSYSSAWIRDSLTATALNNKNVVRDGCGKGSFSSTSYRDSSPRVGRRRAQRRRGQAGFSHLVLVRDINFKHKATSEILPDARGQQTVQQVQLTSTQLATKSSNDWTELQNGIVPTN